MEPDEKLRTVTAEHRFNLPAEHVYDAWLDAKTVGRWLFATPTGKMKEVTLEPVPGGHFRIVDERDGLPIAHDGQYLELKRPRRIAFLFAVKQFSPQETKVTLDFAPAGSGTQLSLTHEGVLPEWAEKTAEGWRKILESLDAVLQGEARAANL